MQLLDMRGAIILLLGTPFFNHDALWIRGAKILLWDAFFPPLGHPELGVPSFPPSQGCISGTPRGVTSATSLSPLGGAMWHL